MLVSAPALPPIGDLLQMPYGPSAFSEGMTSDDFRQQHRELGYSVRHWKGFENAGNAQGPNGETANRNDVLLIEQTVADDVRVLIYDADKTTQLTEVGLLATGKAMISALPDEIELARPDVLVVTHPKLAFLSRMVLYPSGGEFDLFGHGFISQILSVHGDFGPLSPASYALHERGITWTSAAPTAPVLIEYKAFLSFEFEGASEQISPIGTDDKSLPRIGVLRLLPPGEEFLK